MTVASGMLTLENYLPWAKRELRETSDHKVMFQQLIDSEQIRQNFWSLPHIARIRVITQITFGTSAMDAGAIIQLRMQLNDAKIVLPNHNRATGSIDWVTEPSDSIIFSLRSHSEPELKSIFEREVSKFKEFQEAIEVLHYGVGVDDVTFVAYLLKVLYGDDRVIEVMRAWQSNPIQHSIYEFIQLAHSWSDDVKVYPIEWSLNLFETHYES